MFNKMKQCKTLKELFACIGTKPFEYAGFVITILWCIVPIVAVGERVYWAIFATSNYQRLTALREWYKFTVLSLGYVTVYVAGFFLFSRIAVYGKKLGKKIKEEPWHFLLLLMLFWACISTARAEDIKLAYEGDGYLAEGLRNYFFYAAIYICSFIIIDSKKKTKILNVFNIVACIISAIIIFVDMTNFAFIEKCFSMKLAGVFFHYNHAGYYINVGILCAMGLYLYEERRRLRIWYAFCIALQVYGILVNSTLGSFFGTCGALIIILILYARSKAGARWRMWTPIVIVIGLVIASYFGYVPTSSGEDMKANLELLVDNGDDIISEDGVIENVGHGRIFLWKQGLKMIPGSPIFGYGPEHLDDVYSKEMWIMRPDNEFIQHAVFLGVPALLYYLISLISLFVHQCRLLKKLDKNILIAAGGMIAYLGSAMFGVSTFYVTPYLYLFWGMAAGRTPERQEEIENELNVLKAEVNECLEKRLLEQPQKEKRNKKKKETDINI